MMVVDVVGASVVGFVAWYLSNEQIHRTRLT